MSIKYVKNLSKPFRKIQSTHLFFLLLLNLSALALAYLMGKMVDALGSYRVLGLIIGLIVLLKLGDSVLKYRLVLLEKEGQAKMHQILGRSIPDKLSRIPYALFEDGSLQDLFHFIQAGPERILLESLFNINQLISLFIQVFGIFLLLSRVSVYLLLILPLCLGMILRMDFKGIQHYNTMHYDQSRKEREKAYYENLLHDRYSFFDLKMKKALSFVSHKIRGLQEDILKEKFSIVLRREKYFFFSMLFIIIALASLLSFLFLNLARGQITSGLAVASLLLLPTLLSSLEIVGYLLTLLGENMGILEKYHAFQQIKEIDFSHQDISSLQEGFSLTFEGVSFSYPNSDK